VHDLIAHAELQSATSVFEFGCGTGRLAETLLRSHLPAHAKYAGVDISSTMVALASERLRDFSSRASVIKSNGAIEFPVDSHSVDRVISTYVLDILSEESIRTFLSESRRVLTGTGLLCLASLGRGGGPLARVVTALWQAVFRLAPRLVGGCRPIDIAAMLGAEWTVAHRAIVTPYAIASEIVIARPLSL
jgi:ubiquinone/menaquinone biosynthesis C-methylase UbiE